MFEQEIEMEKKSSSIVPLLLIVVLIVGIVGVSLYFVVESRKVLSTAEATPIIQALLEGQRIPVLHVETGNLKDSAAEKVHEAYHRLLEKEGYLRIKKESASRMAVALTPQGQALLAEIPGVKESKTKDGYKE